MRRHPEVDACAQTTHTFTMAEHPYPSSFVHLLHAASRTADAVLGAELAPLGLTARQAAVVLGIAQHEGVNQVELSKRVHIDRTTLSQILLRMDHKGLILRGTDNADLRVNVLRLSEAGKKLLPALKKADRDASRKIARLFNGVDLRPPLTAVLKTYGDT
jgi:DNA-binding MarR family transcriptional regulator